MKLSLDTLEEQLYLGHLNGPCPYLPDRESRLLFLNGHDVGMIYRLLLDAGYRRHGQHLYRPDCDPCRECRVLRIPTATFAPTRSQKRVFKRGSRVFTAKWTRPATSDEKIAMYARYLASQHRDPDANDPENLAPERYEDFFVRSFLGEDTLELQLFADGRLAGVGILDRIHDALSSVYFYFDPEFSRYSPGTYSMIVEIEAAREWGLKYYYPGYYIHDCAAMNYKAAFGPNQIKDRAAEWADAGQADAPENQDATR